MEKQCKICKRVLPLDQFHLDNGLLDGHRNICKDCAKNRAKMSRNEKREKTQGLSDVLHSMKSRCYNPKHKSYKRYGGRGITICHGWLENEKSFYDWCMNNGYEQGLQLDRIDNNKGYCPENCRFVTRSENQQNAERCPYSAREVAFFRRAYHLGAITQHALAEFYGVDQSTISKICTGHAWRDLHICHST